MIQSTAETLERMYTMSTKTLLSLATIALFAATAKADSISAGESSDSWFAVDASEANISGSGWTGPVSGSVEVSATIDVDTAATDPLKYALPGNKLSATRISISGYIKGIVLNAATPANDLYSGTVPRAALVAVDAATDCWYAWHCTDATTPSSEQGAWVQMTGPTPEEGTDYYVTIEFKKDEGQNKIRYGVSTTTTPTWLTSASTGEDGWMDNAKDYSTMEAVGLAGYGSFGDFGGLVVKAITIDTSNIDEDAYGKITAETNLDEKKNVGDKLTIRQAILLGLDSPSDDPIPSPVQTGDDFLGFTISNADLDKYGTDAYVTLEVYEVEDPSDDISAGTLKGSGSADGTVKVSPEKSGVRYYKTKIIFH